MNKDKCCVEGCSNPIKVQTKQLCEMHYTRLRRHGNVHITYKPRRKIRTCAVKNCDLDIKSLGLCHRHYYAYKTSSPDYRKHLDQIVLKTKVIG
ncbi:hypothetical protein ACTWQB_12685 [Piscibacillus sp. B03]|uniref:hypothetical protein n=1 Tax=Piscibacillus sp. B03 TaxID=3457430 RepID=UPI003FCC8196